MYMFNMYINYIKSNIFQTNYILETKHLYFRIKMAVLQDGFADHLQLTYGGFEINYCLLVHSM